MYLIRLRVVEQARLSKEPAPEAKQPLADELKRFHEFGTPTLETITSGNGLASQQIVPTFINEFWTSKQRAACSLHEISYRACFKPQLPRFFIERLTIPGQVVFDPFAGRGTTAVEAALMGRIPAAIDINPLSRALIEPRLRPPTIEAVRRRLNDIDWESPVDVNEDLLAFFHQNTLRQICRLRQFLFGRERDGTFDYIDGWIRMVAINRLTGHSSGFFSVYTLPPNQAVSLETQRAINEKRKQTPPVRDVRAIVVRKTKTLLSGLSSANRAMLAAVEGRARILVGDCRSVPQVPSGSVSLVVTSPPFLDVVDYRQDNWLRCWFMNIDPAQTPILQLRRIEDWAIAMGAALRECSRLLADDGRIAFEVGEVRSGRVRLEETVLDCAIDGGLIPELVMINKQAFTKTSHAWGVSNQAKGTNSNRIVLLRKQ